MAKIQLEAQFKQAELQLKSQELEIKRAEVGLKDQREKEKLDFEGVKIALNALALEAERANPKDNAIVGV